LLDDRAWLFILRHLFQNAEFALPAAGLPTTFTWALTGVALLVMLLSLAPLARLVRLELEWPGPLERFFDFFEPFHLVNSYGLFSVMTTERPEIIIEGSGDGARWVAYEFKWNPGDPKRAPRFVAPHHPRLDWQMWFAALGFAGGNPWFIRFLLRLLEGSPAVLSLL